MESTCVNFRSCVLGRWWVSDNVYLEIIIGSWLHYRVRQGMGIPKICTGWTNMWKNMFFSYIFSWRYKPMWVLSIFFSVKTSWGWGLDGSLFYTQNYPLTPQNTEWWIWIYPQLISQHQNYTRKCNFVNKKLVSFEIVLIKVCSLRSDWWQFTISLNNGLVAKMRIHAQKCKQRTQIGKDDGVIKWKHFMRYWHFVQGIHWSTVNFPHKGQWCGGLMFSLISAWTNSWVNNRDTSDLRCKFVFCGMIPHYMRNSLTKWFEDYLVRYIHIFFSEIVFSPCFFWILWMWRAHQEAMEIFIISQITLEDLWM